MRWATNETEEQEETIEKYVKTINNNIYFFSDVTNESIFEFIEQFKNLETKLLKSSVELEDYIPNINVFINSNGGDVYAGLSAMDILLKSKIHVTTIAIGCTASAATFILLGGNNVKMTENSTILIHQISTAGFWGKYEELKDEMKTCKGLMNQIMAIYKKNTKIPHEKLNKLMKRDIYLNSKKCIKYGIVSSLY